MSYEGWGRSKKDAKFNAAEALLDHLRQKDVKKEPKEEKYDSKQGSNSKETILALVSA